MAGVWEWVKEYNGTLAIFVSLITGGLALFHYINIKRAEEKARRFSDYHKLIEDLNGKEGGEAPYIDRQMTVVYELRQFPGYYPVTLRILKRSLPHWEKLKQEGQALAKEKGTYERLNLLCDEAKLTIKYIDDYYEMRSYLCLEKDH